MKLSLDSIYSHCYECGRVIAPDPDDEDTGAPYCDGHCERCDKSWGDA
jgi:hypothetical protein